MVFIDCNGISKYVFKNFCLFLEQNHYILILVVNGKGAISEHTISRLQLSIIRKILWSSLRLQFPIIIEIFKVFFRVVRMNVKMNNTNDQFDDSWKMC